MNRISSLTKKNILLRYFTCICIYKWSIYPHMFSHRQRFLSATEDHPDRRRHHSASNNGMRNICRQLHDERRWLCWVFQFQRWLTACFTVMYSLQIFCKSVNNNFFLVDYSYQWIWWRRMTDVRNLFPWMHKVSTNGYCWWTNLCLRRSNYLYLMDHHDDITHSKNRDFYVHNYLKVCQ